MTDPVLTPHAEEQIRRDVRAGYSLPPRRTRDLLAEVDRLRLRVLQLENEIIGNLQGDLAILSEQDHLSADELRQDASDRYRAALERWVETT